MARRNLALPRRVALVALTRAPAPASYDHTPHNRQQRRTLARAMRKARSKNKGR